LEDILEQLDVAVQHTQVRTQTEQIAPETDSERHILGLLGVDPTHVDELARHSGLQMGVVTSTLTLLELKGLARKVGHMQYILAR
jgi:DNA processing protein